MTRQIESLQILRALAASLVVFDHFVTACLQRMGRTDVDLHGLWFAGALGVDIFFCISGYIITLSLLPTAGGRGQPAMADFYRRRFIRVAPLYWLATAVAVLRLVWKGEPPSLNELLQSLLFVPYADAEGLMRPVLGLGWSLNFEMFFYLVLGQALWLRTRWAAAAVAGTVLLPLWLLALWVPQGTLQQVMPGATGLLIDPVLGYFLAGVALAYLAPPLCRARQNLRLGLPTLATLQCAVVAWLVAWVLVWPNSLRLAEAVRAPLAIGLVLLCALQREAALPAGRGLSLAVRLGDASYSTYLSHAFFVGAGATVLADTGVLRQLSLAQLWVLGLLALPAFNLVGLWVHTQAEKPLLRHCSQLFMHRRAGPTP